MIPGGAPKVGNTDSTPHSSGGPQTSVHTGGGAYVGGGVQTNGGDFIGRDQHIHGDQIRGNKYQNIFNLFPLVGRTSDAELAAKEPENRQALLTKVHQAWITDVLHQSTFRRTLIALGKDLEPQALRHPWGVNRLRAASPPEPWPPDRSLGDLLRAPGAGLLILGTPGAGKTITLLEVADEAIGRARQAANEPIPVVFNLSSWAPHAGRLADWLVQELHVRYHVHPDIGQWWVANNALLFLLDGLDEVHAEHQAACVDAINQFRQDHGPARIVVCCRRKDYDRLLRHQGLELLHAVMLQSLTPEQVEEYLDKLGSPAQPLRDAYKQSPTLRELAESPLLLNLLVLTYQSGSGDGVRARLGYRRTEAEQRLLSDFVDSRCAEHRNRLFAYEAVDHEDQEHAPMPTYTKEQMLHWLGWLAHTLGGTVFHLERMQPDWLPTQRAFSWYQFINIVAFGLTAALFGGLVVGLGGGLDVGMVLVPLWGLGLGLFGGRTITPAEKVRWSWRDALGRLGVGLGDKLLVRFGGRLIVGFITGLLSGLAGSPGIGLLHVLLGGLVIVLLIVLLSVAGGGLSDGLGGGLSVGLSIGMLSGVIIAAGGGLGFGLGVGLLGGLAIGLLGGLRSEADVETRTTPNQGIWRSVRTAPTIGLGFGLLGGLGFGLLGGLGFGSGGGLFIWPGGGLHVGLLVGLLGALLLGLTGGLIYGGSAFLNHFILRLVLWRCGVIPLHYVPFLDYCVDRLFLYRVGGGYVFIHRRIQEYFASLYEAKQQTAQ